MIKCLIGSQNYGLDGPDSDKDYYIYNIPTLDDLYYNKSLVEERPYENGINFYKDIRSLANMIHRASFNQLEILYSKERTIVESCLGLWNWMQDNRENIIMANVGRLHSSTLGEMNRRINDLEKGKYTAGTHHLFDKYGYDTKNAMHAFRLYWTFINLIERDPFEFEFHMTSNIDNLLIIKNGHYHKDHMINILKDAINRLSKCFDLNKYKKNDNLANELETRIFDVVRNNIK